MKRLTISDYGKFRIPPPAGTREKERPSYMDLYQLLCAYEDTGLEPEEIREFAEDVIRQFAYKVKADGRCAYSTGGLSTLEWAFSILGWPDPKPAPECECQEEGCHEWTVGGRPTPDGYKWLCSRHFADYKAREEAEA